MSTWWSSTHTVLVLIASLLPCHFLFGFLVVSTTHYKSDSIRSSIIISNLFFHSQFHHHAQTKNVGEACVNDDPLLFQVQNGKQERTLMSVKWILSEWAYLDVWSDVGRGRWRRFQKRRFSNKQVVVPSFFIYSSFEHCAFWSWNVESNSETFL